jgi:two-component system, NarL family, nitrate/nitrite response regulator NarL
MQDWRPMAPERVRLVIADDHPVYREGLVRGARERPELELVADVGDGRAALETIREHQPDVALLDVRMPELKGLDVLNALRRDRMPTRVVFLSAHIDSDTVYRAIAMGAGAYLSKESTRREIFDAVMTVSRGQAYVPPSLQTALAEQIQLREVVERPVLSPRELEILRLTADGRSAPEIAGELHLSPATVKTHMQNLYEKLGVSDRAAAVAEAMRRGLIE